MLKKEGFSYQGYVDIFDGGASIEATTQSIRAVADSRVLVLAIGTPGEQAESFLIHNRKCESARITGAPARVAAGSLIVNQQTADRLKLTPGASVRAVLLNPPKRS